METTGTLTESAYDALRKEWGNGAWTGQAAMGPTVDMAHKAWLTAYAMERGCAWCGGTWEDDDTPQRAHVFPIRTDVRKKFVPWQGTAVVHSGCNARDKRYPGGVVPFERIARKDWFPTVPSREEVLAWYAPVIARKEERQAARNAAREA